MAFKLRRSVETMTVTERFGELRIWLGVLEIDFALTHQRIEELMGRPVWTHEIADPESLYAELCSGEQATMDDVLGKLPADRIIVVEVESPSRDAERSQA